MRPWSDISTAEQEHIVWSARKLMGFVSWRTLAERFNVGVDALRRRLDPDYAESSKFLRRQARERVGSEHRWGTVPLERIDLRELRRLKAMVPADTRTVSQRLMGDPLPGRSALDRMAGRI